MSFSQSHSKKTELLFFLFLLVFYTLAGSGRLGSSGDGKTMYLVARSLVYEGKLDIPPQEPAVAMNEDNPNPVIPYGAYGPDGHYYAKYGLGASLAMAPLVAMGKALSAVGNSPLHPYFPQLTASWFNSLVLASAGALFFLLARRLGFTFPTATTLTFAFAFSWAWAYTKTTYSEPLTLLLLLLTVYAGVQMQNNPQRKWLVIFSAASGALALTRISAAVFLPALYLYLLFTQRARFFRRSPFPTRNWLATFLPLGGFLLLVAWYNAFRFGAPWNMGYQTQNYWLTPFFLGVYGLALSPGKGILWYLPLASIAVFGYRCFSKKRPPETILFLVLVLLSITFHASFSYWEGGWAWGPRFLLPIVPYLLLPLGCLLDKKRLYNTRWFQFVFALLLVSSILVQIPVIAVDYTRHLIAVYQEYPDDFDHQVLFTWESSPLLGQWKSMLAVTSIVRQEQIRTQLSQTAWKTASEEADTPEEIVATALNLLSINTPDLWFVYFPLLHLAAISIVYAILTAQFLLLLFLGIMLQRSSMVPPPGIQEISP